MEEIKEEKVSTGVSIDDAFSDKKIEKKKEPTKDINKDKITFKKIFLHSPIKYLVSLVMVALIVVLALSIKGFNYLVNYANGFFIAGALLIGVGLLSICNNLGTFDIFGYSGKYVINRIRNVNVEDFPEYTENKKEKRKKIRFEFVPYIVVGLFSLIVAIILLIILG